MLAHEILGIAKKQILQKAVFQLRSTNQNHRVLNDKELNKCKRDINVVLDAYVEDLKSMKTNTIELVVSRFFDGGDIQLKTSKLETEIHTNIRDIILQNLQSHNQSKEVMEHLTNCSQILLDALEAKTYELNGTSPIVGLLRNRFTCRSFSDKPVEQEKLKVILDALELAPCKQNNFPVQLTVLGPGAQEVKDSLFYDSNCWPDHPHLQNPQLLAPLVFVFTKRRMETLSREPGTPTDLNPDHHAYDHVYNIQSGIFSTIICLTAESLGLNTGYCFSVGEGVEAGSMIGQGPVEFAIGVGYARTDVNPRHRTRPQDPPENASSTISERRPNVCEWIDFYGL